MNWDIVLQYLPDGICILLCLFGCLCNFVRSGSIKKTLQSMCPSYEPVLGLEDRVTALEARLDEIQAAITSALGGVHDD